MRTGLAALLVVGLFDAANALARDTARCNSAYFHWVSIRASDDAALDALGTLLIRPRDTEQHYALWTPIGAARRYLPLYGHFVTFTYAPEQDVWEIAEAMRRDALLKARGLANAWVEGGGCGGGYPVPVPPGNVPLVEYHNSSSDLYALATNAEEAYALESGARGPGWRPSGQVLYTGPAGMCAGLWPVYQFHAPASGAHFFTNDPDECGSLRREGTGWLYSRIAFAGGSPVLRHCPGEQAPTPVYRFYNDRASEGLANHRYVVDPNVRQQMAGGGGWIEEGVAMCLPPQPPARDAPISSSN